MSDNISLARIYSRKYLKISTNQIQGISDYNYSFSFQTTIILILTVEMFWKSNLIVKILSCVKKKFPRLILFIYSSVIVLMIKHRYLTSKGGQATIRLYTPLEPIVCWLNGPR